MANKKNGKNNEVAEAIAANGNGNSKKKDSASGAPPEESSAGMMATVIAAVAILVVAGSIGAFVLFIKAKNAYLDPLMKNRISDTSNAGVGNTANSEGLDDIYDSISGSSVPSATPGVDSDYPGVVPPSSGTSSGTEPPVYVPPVVPIDPVVPEDDEENLEEVGSYDFNSKLASMDSKMNQISEEIMNADFLLPNDYFGF
jgi:hypothetical protein